MSSRAAQRDTIMRTPLLLQVCKYHRLADNTKFEKSTTRQEESADATADALFVSAVEEPQCSLRRVGSTDTDRNIMIQ